MNDNLFKAFVKLEKDSSIHFDTESFWIRLDDDGFYTLLNTPFFAKGISFGDRFNIKIVNQDLYLDKKIEESGHSTYRVYRTDDAQEIFAFFLSLLENLECTYEQASENLYAIDVPITTNIFEVYKILELGEVKGSWGFEEAHCSTKALEKYQR